MEYYYNNDHTAVAVLLSRGFGAGWSTWNYPELAYDKRIVEFWLDHRTHEFCEAIDHHSSQHPTPEGQEIEDFLAKCGYLNVYLGGYGQITAEWVPLNRQFRIDEYDGAETVVYQKDIDWMVFN